MGVLVRHTVPDFLFLEGTIIGLLELFLIAVGLSMDAFAVSSWVRGSEAFRR